MLLAGLSLSLGAESVKKINIEYNDGTATLSIDRSKVKRITFTQEYLYEMTVNGHTVVYLGAVDSDGKPTETLWWATTNIGASSPQEYGTYCTASTDATTDWGSPFRVPTKDDYQKLVDLGGVWQDATVTDDTHTDGGCTITSPITNKSIFIPAAGSYYNGSYFYRSKEINYYSTSTNDYGFYLGLYYSAYYEGAKLGIGELGPGSSNMPVRAVADISVE